MKKLNSTPLPPSLNKEKVRIWGNYYATPDGNIWKNDRVMRPYKTSYGYLRIDLMKDGVRKRLKVHRIIAELFVPNPQPDIYKQVNHKNEDKTDNRACNLEWCDARYNLSYGTRGYKIALKIGKRVAQKTKDGRTINEFISIERAAQYIGTLSKRIALCCHKKKKTYKGYLWEFI